VTSFFTLVKQKMN